MGDFFNSLLELPHVLKVGGVDPNSTRESMFELRDASESAKLRGFYAMVRMNDPLPGGAVRLPQILSAPDHGLLMARDQKAEFFETDPDMCDEGIDSRRTRRFRAPEKAECAFGVWNLDRKRGDCLFVAKGEDRAVRKDGQRIRVFHVVDGAEQ